MRKFLIILVIMGMAGTTCIAEVVRNGNTFETVQTSQTDPYTWKDKDGKTYPITKKGACYVKRI